MALVPCPSHSMAVAHCECWNTLPGNTRAQFQGSTDPGELQRSCTLSGGRGRALPSRPAVPLTLRAGPTSFTRTDLTPEARTFKMCLSLGTELAGLSEQMLFFTIQAPLKLLIKCYYLLTEEPNAFAEIPFVNAKIKINSLLEKL